jgi:hypothetical protein
MARCSRAPIAPMPRPDSDLADGPHLSFGDLAFPVGTRLALRFDDDTDERSLILALIGWLEPESVLAGGASRIVLPEHAREGAPLRGRLRQGSLVCTFASRVLSVRLLPHPLLQLAWPDSLHLSRVRDAMRVRTGIPAVALVDDDEEPVPCTIRDLSPKGVRVVAPARFGELGCRVDLRFTLPAGEADHPVTMGGHLRHVAAVRINGHAAGWTHGVVISAIPLAALETIERFLRERRAGRTAS